jgi:hypothetical protein
MQTGRCLLFVLLHSSCSDVAGSKVGLQRCSELTLLGYLREKLGFAQNGSSLQ